VNAQATVQWSIALIIAALAVTIVLMAVEQVRGHGNPPAATDPGCPWCDSHAGPCDCTGPCGRPRCRGGEYVGSMIAVVTPDEPDPVDAEIEQMLRKWGRRG
jgi:hypothetical protein